MKKFFLLFIITINFLLLPFGAYAENSQEPFHIEILLIEQKEQNILAVEFIPTENNYTYAPNQSDVYPTKISFYQDSLTNQNKIPLFYPLAKTKQDPLNPSQLVQVYEQSFIVYGVVPKDFLGKGEISFLACSAMRCQPYKKAFNLLNSKKIAFSDYQYQKEVTATLGEYENKTFPIQQLDYAQIKNSNAKNKNTFVPTVKQNNSIKTVDNLSAFSID